MRSFAPPQQQTPVARNLAPSRTATVEPDQTPDHTEVETPDRPYAIANSPSHAASGTALGPSDNTPNKSAAPKVPRFGWDLSRISIHPSPVIQTKLAINQPGDKFEQEADRIAQQVMRMETPAQAPPATTTAPPTIQRKCACGGTCSKCKGDDPEHKLVQRKPADATASHPLTVPSSVHQVLSSPGVPLDAATRAFMEPRFGHDFSQIRIHADPTAARSAAEIQARAYTIGRNIVFAHREFSPSTPQGQELLAHELVHTLQQSRGSIAAIQRSPASPQAQQKPQILKIVAFEQEDEEDVAKDKKYAAEHPEAAVKNKRPVEEHQDAVAYVAYPADADMAEKGGTVPELVTVKENKLRAGEYTLHRDDQARTRYSGGPADFVWYNPWLDSAKKESKYGWANTVHITILPKEIQSFLEKGDGPKATTGDVTSEIRAAEILVKSGIGPEDLRREEHQANDYFLKPEEVDPVLWAQSLAEKKVKQESVALANRKTFLAAAMRLSKIRGKLDAETVALYLTDPTLANERFLQHDIHPVISATGDHSGYYLEGTDFEDKADLQATATIFSNALDFELHALAEAVLNATESAILVADSKFTGLFNTTKGKGRLADELEKLNKDSDVKKLTSRIAYEKAHPPQIDPETDLKDDDDDSSSVHKYLRKVDPLSALAADQREAEKEHDEEINSLKKKLNDTVNAKSELRVAGLKGFDAYDFLPKPTESVRSDLSDALAGGSRRIDEARKKLRDPSKFVYSMDKIIDLEKAQLHVTAGSSLDVIIDGVVDARLQEKTVWESVVEIINILAALPIPPPAGPILRAVAAGINIGESLDKAAAQDLAADNKLRKEGSSKSALALDIVITAAGTIADAPSIESHAAASTSHEFAAEESEIAHDATAGRNAEGEGANLAAEQREIDAAGQSLHLPPDPEAERRTANELKKTLAEHPPAEKDIHGLPGQREAEFTPGHKVKEIRTPSGIHCEIWSDPPHIPTDCGEIFGDAAAAALHGPSKALTARLENLSSRLPSHVTLPQRNRLERILIKASEEGVPLGEDQLRQISAALGRTKQTKAAEEVLDNLEQSIETHLNARDAFGETEGIGSGSQHGDLGEAEASHGGSQHGDPAGDLPGGTHALKTIKNPKQVDAFLKRYPKVKDSQDSVAALDALYSHTRSGSASNARFQGLFLPRETRPAAAELESIIELSEREDVVLIELKPSSSEGRTTDKIVYIKQRDGKIVPTRYEDTTLTGAKSGTTTAGDRTNFQPRANRYPDRKTYEEALDVKADVGDIRDAVRGKIESTLEHPSQFDAPMAEASPGGTLAVHIQRPSPNGAQDVAAAMTSLGPDLSNSSVQAVEFYLPATNPANRDVQVLRRQVLRYERQTIGGIPKPNDKFILVKPPASTP